MDTFILAGGHGTRLKGIWDKPKCLVRVSGRPLIEHLVNLVLPFSDHVYLLLGRGAAEVVAWREYCCPHKRVIPIIETEPLGTAGSIRHAYPWIRSYPVLILNGDTLPHYDLRSLIGFHEVNNGSRLSAAVCRLETGEIAFAGAAIIGEKAMAAIVTDHRTHDFPAHLLGAERFYVPGFLDVGTPEGFKIAREITTEELHHMETYRQ